VAAGAILLMLAAAQPAPDGADLFQRCVACHSVDPRERGLQGPNLAGVVGRRAARVAGFEYSPAMRQAGARGLVWTEATLDRFLADAEAVVPKSEMFTPPLRRPADRAALIAYLKSPKGRSR
jgi:cytochrome c